MSSVSSQPHIPVLKNRFCSFDPRGPFVDLGSAKGGFDQIVPFILAEDQGKLQINWLGEADTSRSRRYQLNAWLGFSDLILKAHKISSEAEIKTARRILLAVQDWHEKHPFDPEDPTGKTKENIFAWYDMAVGLRAAVLGYLWTKSGCEAGFSEEGLTCLADITSTHLDYLRSPDLWMSHSNHGFYQSAGFLSLVTQAQSVIPDANEYRDIAISRITHYIENTISPSGVHREHSPLYHSFLFMSVAALTPWLDANRPAEKTVMDMFDRLQFAKAAMFLPNGLMLPVGDSRFATASDRLRLPEDALKQLRPELRNILPDRQDQSINQFLPALDAGLAIHKIRTNDSRHYFAMTSSYHGSVHKTRDDMSVFWAEDDIPILTDPGYYGYSGKTDIGSDLRSRGFYYSDPKRIFVESTHAHNTVEIDGQTENRHARLQYGSAIIAANRHETGWSVFEADRVRSSHVHHNRIVLSLPGETLLILDRLSDLKGRPRRFTQWLQFFPSWKLSRSDSGFTGQFQTDWVETQLSKDKKVNRHVQKVASAIGRTEKSLSVLTTASVPLSTELYHGAETPRFQGWTSLAPDSFTPAAALSIEPSKPQPETLIATLIRYAAPDSDITGLRLAEEDKDTILVSWQEVEEPVSFKIGRFENQLKIILNDESTWTVEEIRSEQSQAVDRALRYQANTGNWPNDNSVAKRSFIRRVGAKTKRLLNGSK